MKYTKIIGSWRVCVEFMEEMEVGLELAGPIGFEWVKGGILERSGNGNQRYIRCRIVLNVDNWKIQD